MLVPAPVLFFRTAVLPLYPCIERLINNIGWQYGCLRHAVKAGLQNYMVVWVYSASNDKRPGAWEGGCGDYELRW